jgi:putative Ca2+/H+ antiporter (TMEM165/GDT1 family)
MDALLFAFLLTFLLDQGDRTQQLALALAGTAGKADAARSYEGEESGALRMPGLPVLLLLLFIVVFASLALAAGGVWLGSYLPPKPRMLFLALAILIGASGFLVPMRAGLVQRGMMGSRPVLAGRLLIARLNGRSGFGLLGFATFSGDPTGVSAGGILAGLLTTFMPLFVGPAYLTFFNRPAVRIVLGIVLMLVAVPLALHALGLLID